MRGLSSHKAAGSGEGGMIGLLDGITDPEVMRLVAERQRIIARVIELMGVTRARAIEALDDFEANICHESQTLH
jgi:hypothetical protein